MRVQSEMKGANGRAYWSFLFINEVNVWFVLIFDGQKWLYFVEILYSVFKEFVYLELDTLIPRNKNNCLNKSSIFH